MNQTQALTKLRKIIGPKVSYRIDSKALPADEREAKQAKVRELRAKKQAAEEASAARRAELLRDPVYRALRAEVNALDAEIGKHLHAAYAKRITVGVVGGMFFSVRAEGDNWAEVVAAAEAKQ